MNSSKTAKNVSEHAGAYLLMVHNKGAGGVDKYGKTDTVNMNYRRYKQVCLRQSRAIGTNWS